MIKKFSIEFSEMNCGGCGVTYFIPEVLYSNLSNTHKGFYCPNGCSRAFLGKSKEEILKDELTSLKAKNDQLMADIEVKNKKIERINNGVCPCCNRTFKNLQRHMITKHSINPSTKKG